MQSHALAKINTLFTFQRPQINGSDLLRRTGSLSATRVIGRLAGFEPAALVAETGEVNEPDPLQPILQGGGEDSKSILHAAAKIYG
jgi:hypothetical protein